MMDNITFKFERCKCEGCNCITCTLNTFLSNNKCTNCDDCVNASNYEKLCIFHKKIAR